MAGSLDELIEFLLQEITFAGESGLAFQDLAIRVRQFYDPTESQQDPTDSNDGLHTSKVLRKPIVDRAFLSKVWTWLGRHPDVSIGKDKQYNSQSLDEIEKVFPGYTNPTEKVTSTSAPPVQNDGPDTGEATDSAVPDGPDRTPGPHILVSEKRMSIAICGHPPDPTRVFPSEWTLLLCVAKTKTDGILQGDLVRESGQDKRSVPRRTDVLQEKGYVFKRIIYIKGNKTSRIYLRKFAEGHQANRSGGTAVGQLTVRHVAHQLFDVLRNNPLSPYEDLSDALGMTRPGRARILSQLVRHFSKAGCIKRVKTAFGPSARSKDLKVCIQFLKDPSDEDWLGSTMDNLDFDQAAETLASLYEYETGQSSREINDEVNNDELDDEETLNPSIAMQNSDHAARLVLPQWNPDRILANVLFQMAQDLGLVGLRNMNARNTITGPFIRRTLESLLVKVSNRTLQAQPPELRHLAIVRTQRLHSGTLQYMHFTFEAYAKQVKDDQAKWSDVSGGEDYLKELQKQENSASNKRETTVAVDSFGFAIRARPTSQVRGGEVTMVQLLHDSKAKEVGSRIGEPYLKEVAPGQFEVKCLGQSERHLQKTTQTPRPRGRPPGGKRENLAAPAKRPELGANSPADCIRTRATTGPIESPADSPMSPSTPNKAVRILKQVDEHGQPIKGRPRKFVRGTEKYWRDVFTGIVQARDPSRIKDRGRAGVTNDPEALRIFKQRPADFDKTILMAMELGLPLALSADNISQDWIDKTIAVIDRREPGLYVTPAGFHVGSCTKKSQRLIFRSTRLAELDLSDRKKYWPWQYISSSASHSYRYQSHRPQFDAKPRHTVRSPEKTLAGSRPDHASNPALVGPPRGVFYENVQPTSLARQAEDVPVTAQLIEHNTPFEVGKSMSVIDSDTEDEVVTSRTRRTQKQLTTDDMSDKSAIRATSAALQPTIIPLTTTTRPTRKRKLTRKVVENQAAMGTGSINTKPPVKNPTTPDNIDRVAAKQIDAVASNTVLPVTLPDSSCGDLAMTEVVETEQPADKSVESPLQMDLQKSDKRDLGNQAHSLQDEVCHPEVRTAPSCGSLELAEGQGQEPVNDLSSINGHGNLIVPGQDVEAVLETIPLAQELDVDYEPRPNDPRDIPAHPHDYPGGSENRIMTVSPPKSTSKPKKRPRAEENNLFLTPRGEQEDETSHPRKRSKVGDALEIKRRQVSKLCRIMVLELVGMCSGLAPNVPWTLRRAMVPRWQEAGVKPDQLNAKNVRAAIKALCESGKLKQFTFAFRAKSGSMLKLSVIALRGIDATNPAVLDLQKKMSDMAPADYIPPELEAEEIRLPSELNKKRYSREIQREDSPDDLDEQSESKPSRKRRRKTQVQAANEPGPRPESGPEQAQADITAIASPPLSPLPEPEITPNTGFLTLKVPRLESLNLPAEPPLNFRPPPVTLRFETNPNTINLNITEPAQKAVRRSGIRRKRTARFDPETHKLVWKKPRKYELPTRLDDIPNIKISRDEAVLAATGDIRSVRFEAEVNCVASWEEKSPDLFEGQHAEQLVFINHTFTQATSDVNRDTSSIEFKAVVQFDPETGEEIEIDFPHTESWPAFVKALHAEDMGLDQSAPKSRRRRTKKSSKRKANVTFATDLVDDDSDGHVERVAKKRKQGVRPTRPRRSIHSVLAEESQGPSPLPWRRNRMVQLMRRLTEEQKYEVVVAVVLVRTLAGGIEKFVDWKLVTRLLPSYPDHILKEAWKTMSNRYRGDVSDLTDSLQQQYLEALVGDEVPSINFESVHESDWEGLLKWALQNLDKTIVRKIEELPASRAQLLRRTDCAFSEFRGVRELISYNTPQTIPRKEEIMSGTVFGKPLKATPNSVPTLEVKFPAEEEELDQDFSRAKSWVMATLLGPETIQPSVIQAKLLTLASTPHDCEALLEKAVKSLQRDKTISRSNRNSGVGRGKAPKNHNPVGSFNNLRTYEASSKFFEQFDFRRLVTTTMLKRAAKYKFDVLDVAFTENTSITLAADTVLEDGEMVAILNLLAMGMLRARPGSGVPASRWGLQWQKHGYTTRMIDKKALGFSVVLSHVQGSYVLGDPVAKVRSAPEAVVPRGEIDRVDRMGRIPKWFDITHTFQPPLWEMVLGAALGLVSTRPGIDAVELARTFWHGVTVAEVEMVLAWAERCGLVKKTGLRGHPGGWECCDWWWLGVGVGGEWNVYGTSTGDGGVRTGVQAQTEVQTEPGPGPGTGRANTAAEVNVGVIGGGGGSGSGGGDAATGHVRAHSYHFVT